MAACCVARSAAPAYWLPHARTWVDDHVKSHHREELEDGEDPWPQRPHRANAAEEKEGHGSYPADEHELPAAVALAARTQRRLASWSAHGLDLRLHRAADSECHTSLAPASASWRLGMAPWAPRVRMKHEMDIHIFAASAELPTCHTGREVPPEANAAGAPAQSVPPTAPSGTHSCDGNHGRPPRACVVEGVSAEEGTPSHPSPLPDCEALSAMRAAKRQSFLDAASHGSGFPNALSPALRDLLIGRGQIVAIQAGMP